ncbi:MAG: HD domain-containing protein [Candidatus Coatesbacteria bacterium]|nr:HD domain-containing protein [Candidatus Coatesbacteria bacterium]
MEKKLIYIGSPERSIIKKLKETKYQFIVFHTVKEFADRYDKNEEFNIIIIDASLSQDELYAFEGGGNKSTVILAISPEESIQEFLYSPVADVIFDDYTPSSIIEKKLDRFLIENMDHKRDYLDKLEELEKEKEEKVYQLELIKDINLILGKVLQLDELLSAILKLALDFTEGKSGAILMLEEQSGNYQVKSFHGLDGEGVSGVRIPKDKGVMSTITQNNIGQIFHSKQEVFHWEPILPIEPDFKSFIAYPISSSNGIPAIILLYDKLNGSGFSRNDYEIVKLISRQAAGSVENARLYESIKMNYYNTVRALAIALEASDPYTRGHSERVSSYAIIIAHSMGLPQDEIHEIEYYAILHDIGKIAIPGEILHKEGALTESEYEIMMTHSQIGADIIASIGFLQKVTSLIRYHHEHWDGNGYYHLKHEQIPVQARIVAVADAYDAMVSDRPYRKAMTSKEAIIELKKHSGTQFDPDVVKVFVQILERFYGQN